MLKLYTNYLYLLLFLHFSGILSLGLPVGGQSSSHIIHTTCEPFARSLCT